MAGPAFSTPAPPRGGRRGRPPKKSRGYVKGKWRLARLRIRMSLAIRRVEFAEAFKRRLVERIRETVDRIRDAEDRIARLEQKLKRDVSDD